MKPLNVVLPCWKGDQDQAVRLLKWIAELGMVQAPFYLACDNQCNVQLLLDLARKAFSKVGWIQDREGIESNWNEVGDHPKSAAGPNSLFRQVAWYMQLNKLGPWLFNEPDAIWCRRDTYQMIEREYTLGGKHFMGYLVSPQNHPGVPNHMSGVAVYPENTPSVAPLASNAGEVAFDIAGVTETCNEAHTFFTGILFHKYRAPSFTTQEDFETRVPQHLALYHANKDGSIIPFIAKRLGISTAPQPTRVVQLEERPAPDRNVEGSTPSARALSMDIFIKTRPHDYPWLEWCFKSIKEFTSGFRELNVMAPIGGDLSFPTPIETKIVWADDREPGYLWQQVCKLNADQTSPADFILFMDSDCVFTRPVTPDDFIKDGKPVWLYTPLDKARPDQHVWAPVMEKFLGKRPEHEFMRRHPFCVPRWALKEFRTFCQYRHGKTIEEYIMGEADPANGLALRFSEWNCLGFFLWEHHRDKVHWVLDSEAGPACTYQGFTHGGEQRKREDLAKFREILNPAEPSSGLVGLQEQGGVTPPTPTFTEASAIEFLASQVKNNFHKARIVRDLKRAWKGKGEAPKKQKSLKHQLIGAGLKEVAVLVKPNSFLLCIHSYPGANETMVRHWPYFKRSGATRIAGIGTTDGKCTWPDGLDAVVDIGENSYMKLKGKDDHLCRRLLDTVKWCLTQPEDRFMIVEYDTLILRKIPHFSGVHAHLTGGQVNGSKTKAFHHNPWAFDRDSGAALVEALQAVLPESAEYPNNSPDLFFGLATERAQIKVKCCFKLFTRNSLDQHGDLELAVEAALEGVHAIHGVKTSEELQTIERALNELHLSLSHVA